MNKEEIEAIENLEHIVEHWKPDENDELANIEYNSIKVAVNLIVKLEKELENLKEVDRQICCEELITKEKYQDILKENEELKEQRDNAIKLRNELIEEQKITCISKNKIRDKIKELTGEIHRTKKGRIILKDIKRLAKIEVLEKLLGG